jgi:two-component system sensor histidine kinase KdpD
MNGITRLKSGWMIYIGSGRSNAQVGLSGAAGDREVKITVAADIPEVLADVRLVQQALGSILSNADSYSPADKAIQSGVARDGNEIVFSVADRGPGLREGEEQKVFEKFYRGPGTPAGGLGLGLSIARQLIEAHGGTISAGNREGDGARFTVRLPIDEAIKIPPESTIV